MSNVTWNNASTTQKVLEVSTSVVEAPWFSDSIDILFGTLLAIATVLGIGLNFSVFGMFFKNRREFNSRTTWVMMSLAASDGLMAAIGGTMFSISSFNHVWPFGDGGCIFYAFVMYATGCSAIGHLTVIALDRVLAITTPIKYRSWRKKPHLTVIALVIPWVFGVFWALLPLVGLQRYTYEGRTSCSIDWLSRAPQDMVYNFMMFVGTYFLPLLIMISAYGIIFSTILYRRMVRLDLDPASKGITTLLTIMLVKDSGKKFPGDEATTAKKRKIEVQLAKNFFLIIVVYMLFWTPYAIVSMWGSFGDPSIIPSPARGFPALLAKFSFVANPLLYALSNKEHRRRLKRFYGMKDNTVRPAPDLHTPPPQDIDDIPDHVVTTPAAQPVLMSVSENDTTNVTSDTSL